MLRKLEINFINNVLFLFSDHMLQPPFSSPKGYLSSLHPKRVNEPLWFIFSGEDLLVHGEAGHLPSSPVCGLERELFFGEMNGHSLFAGIAASTDSLPEGCRWKRLRSLYGQLDEETFALAGRAMQLLAWDREHTYCGSCGKETVPCEKERCRECHACGQRAYPRLSPAIMALVKRGDEILLARGPHFPVKFFSVLAGFVDVGETLEQSLEREVFEEVGVCVKNIRYFGSQPWPFTGSLMIGFTCEWAAGEITIDPLEIEEASWYRRDALPQLPPPLSLARLLIDSFISEK